jgi:hypothetical protein
MPTSRRQFSVKSLAMQVIICSDWAATDVDRPKVRMCPLLTCGVGTLCEPPAMSLFVVRYNGEDILPALLAQLADDLQKAKWKGEVITGEVIIVAKDEAGATEIGGKLEELT